MDKHLNCNQVSALMNFYIEGKLNPKLSECINLHLKECPVCKKKYEQLTEIYNKYKNNNSQNTPKQMQKPDKNFLYNLSAYVDNELNVRENVRIKKMAISNPLARKELETMYKFQKMMKMSYEKTKNNSKYDCAKNIISKIKENPEYSTSYFYKLAILFALLITSILVCFIYLYL